MGRNKNKRDRANLGENLEGAEMERTNVERLDRSMGAERTDRAAGSEGIEDPAIERSNRESMRVTERERSEERTGSRKQQGQDPNRQHSRKRTGQDTEEGESFIGQPTRKEGTPSREATEQTRNQDISES
jgi:hypothetical protein